MQRLQPTCTLPTCPQLRRFAFLSAQNQGWIAHIPSDFVVDPWVSDVESRSRFDCRFLHSVETTFGCLMSAKITSAISMA